MAPGGGDIWQRSARPPRGPCPARRQPVAGQPRQGERPLRRRARAGDRLRRRAGLPAGNRGVGRAPRGRATPGVASRTPHPRHPTRVRRVAAAGGIRVIFQRRSGPTAQHPLQALRARRHERVHPCPARPGLVAPAPNPTWRGTVAADPDRTRGATAYPSRALAGAGNGLYRQAMATSGCGEQKIRMARVSIRRGISSTLHDFGPVQAA